MHIVIGGTANGKRQYVQKHVTNKHVWFGDECFLDLGAASAESAETPLVLCGIEQWMASRIEDEKQAISDLLQCLRNRDVTVIVTDIGRGIVPIDPKERALRDACGRLNQQLMQEAETVTRIWYGIPQQLK